MLLQPSPNMSHEKCSQMPFCWVPFSGVPHGPMVFMRLKSPGPCQYHPLCQGGPSLPDEIPHVSQGPPSVLWRHFLWLSFNQVYHTGWQLHFYWVAPESYLSPKRNPSCPQTKKKKKEASEHLWELSLYSSTPTAQLRGTLLIDIVFYDNGTFYSKIKWAGCLLGKKVALLY